MQLSEFREEIRNNLGEDSEDYWKTSQIDRAINRALRHFCHEEPWAWLHSSDATKSLALSGATIILPDDLDIARTFSVVLQKGTDQPVVAKRVTPAEGIYYGVRHRTNGLPRYYYLESTATTVGGVLQFTVKFTPPADGAYNITFHYMRRPAKLVNAADEPDIPEDYQDGVLAFATATLWLTELQGSAAKAAEQMEIYNAMLENARRDQGRFGEDEQVIFGGHTEEGDHAPLMPNLPDVYGPSFPWGEM